MRSERALIGFYRHPQDIIGEYLKLIHCTEKGDPKQMVIFIQEYFDSFKDRPMDVKTLCIQLVEYIQHNLKSGYVEQVDELQANIGWFYKLSLLKKKMGVLEVYEVVYLDQYTTEFPDGRVVNWGPADYNLHMWKGVRQPPAWRKFDWRIL